MMSVFKESNSNPEEDVKGRSASTISPHLLEEAGAFGAESFEKRVGSGSCFETSISFSNLFRRCGGTYFPATSEALEPLEDEMVEELKEVEGFFGWLFDLFEEDVT